MTSREFNVRNSILWLILVVLAAILRLGPIASGLPYSDYIDEGHVLHQTIRLIKNRSLDTGWYGYPSLPAYLTAGTFIVYGPIYRHFHGHHFRKDLPSEQSVHTSLGDYYDLISPPEFIVAGRFAAACLSVGTVVLAGAIATRFGGRTTGLLAMLITTVCPALVVRASNVIVDTFATFFALLALYFCERMRFPLRLNNRWTGANAAAAGFAAGLAFASKYTAVAVFVAVLTVICMLPTTWSLRGRFSLLAGAGLLAGIAIGTPVTIFTVREVGHNLAVMLGLYDTINSSPGYFGQAISPSELGWPLTIAGCAGIALMLRRKSTRCTVLSWLLFAVVLLAMFVGRPFQPFRNLLPIVPTVCILAAIAFSDLIVWTRQRTYWSVHLIVPTALIGGCVVSLGFSSFRQVQRRIEHTDSRVKAIDWLRQHATKEETVLGIRELSILPAEWKRVAANSTVVPWFEAAAHLERHRFDYIVTGEFDLRYASDSKAWSAYRDAWKTRISTLPVEAEFGQIVTPVRPYLWRTNDERILVLKGSVYNQSDR
jgi:Dolichyl-phosphate-mannose-protein mannosyltransferase